MPRTIGKAAEPPSLADVGVGNLGRTMTALKKFVV
jgi:hypothetical protein